MPKNEDPNLLVGFETSDDAGIYRLTDDIAIVTTADFITPPVDDPYRFGQIAAANAISDVYAMGGRPVSCLNLVMFPSKTLSPDILQQIVAGALDKITEAGAVLAGGHSVENDEPKFGLAVTGVVHPKKFWTNTGARAGDVLVLTKPLGTGVLFNANLKKWVSEDAMTACVETAATLNRAAAETLAGFDVHAATDVTGFGLAGHAFEVATGSTVGVDIDMDTLPVMAEALEMYRKGMNTGVNPLNAQMVAAATRFERELPEWHRQIVYDPQTSGGLLAAVPEAEGEPLLEALDRAGVPGPRIIGRVRNLESGIHLRFT